MTASTHLIDCTNQFSTDYYGFGVRLGCYFAWLSSYCANTLLPAEASAALDTNAIFLLALLVSLFRGSTMGQIDKIDGLILMHLCSGFLFSSFSIWGYRTKYYLHEGPRAVRHFGRFGTHSRLLLTTAIAIYGCWFWWRGVQTGLVSSTQPGCELVTTWLFGNWPVDGGIHIWYVAMSFTTSLYYSGMCMAAFAALVFGLFRVSTRQRGGGEFIVALNASE